MPVPSPASRKVIITCAVTGGAEFNRKHPSFPVTPEEIAGASIEAAKAGAAVVHIHTRDPETGLGNTSVELFEEIADRIRQSPVDVIINLTCGGLAMFHPDPEDESRGGPGTDVAPAEERYRHIEAVRPEICSLDVTTSNQIDSGKEVVYLNTPYTLRKMAKRFQELGVKPEMEAFEAGDLILAQQLIDEGLIDGDPLVQFVLGVKYNAPATPETVSYLRGLLPENSIWGAMGVGRDQFRIAAQSVLLGGNVRVGLEDNLYLKRGVFATNKQLVERAAQLIDVLGHEVAKPNEARVMLGLVREPVPAE